VRAVERDLLQQRPAHRLGVALLRGVALLPSAGEPGGDEGQGGSVEPRRIAR
jgi:hypothetical protein